MTSRPDGRRPDEMRPVSIVTGFQRSPAGSALITVGNTRVICAVSVSNEAPRWMGAADARGWVTAEYHMMAGSTPERNQRPFYQGPSGRSTEIQRLIGRCLRAAVDLSAIPGKTLCVDCDVLDADGGTRCAAITGACVALELACHRLFAAEQIRTWPLRSRVAAVSVGLRGDTPILDLCYREDAAADVDMNVVMTPAGTFVEVQGSAERKPFSRSQMDAMLALAAAGVKDLFATQLAAVEDAVAGGLGTAAGGAR